MAVDWAIKDEQVGFEMAETNIPLPAIWKKLKSVITAKSIHALEHL